MKELRGFERVSLAPSETKPVRFRLGFDELSLIDRRMTRVVEPGRFEVTVGASSTEGKTVSFDVVGSAKHTRAVLQGTPHGQITGKKRDGDEQGYGHGEGSGVGRGHTKQQRRH